MNSRSKMSNRKGNPTSRITRRRRLFALPELLEGRVLMSTYTVTSIADSGDGSLRAAILAANANPGADTIDFAVGSGTQHISLASALPAITDSVTIDGTTQGGTGYVGAPLIWIDANGSAGNGLTLTSGNSTIEGLAITGFKHGAAIELDGPGGNTVQNNYLGLPPSGVLPEGQNQNTNNLDGINILFSDGNFVIGNVISENGQDGVFVDGDNNTIQGNKIGTRVDGTGILTSSGYSAVTGNGHDGILVQSGLNTVIGGDTEAERNIISGNSSDGVEFANASSADSFADSLVKGNYIGVDVSGAIALGNSGNDVEVTGNPNASNGQLNFVGNTISGSGGDGIRLNDGANNVFIRGNYIGVDSTGAITLGANGNPLGNYGNGISILGSASNNTIGGTTADDRNIISGNRGDGVSTTDNMIWPTGTGNSILGNYIGTDINGIYALVNIAGAGNGVTSAGDRLVIKGNLISGNNGFGVELDGNGNIVQDNHIGTQADGIHALGNQSAGVMIGYNNPGSGNQIGGVDHGNVIAFNNGDGVAVFDGTANAIQCNAIYANFTSGQALGGYVFFDTSDNTDTNNNGVFDVNNGEIGVNGATITLTGTDDLGRSISLTTLSGLDGSYSFTGLRLGIYTLTETPPQGLDVSAGIDTAGLPDATAGIRTISNLVLTGKVNPDNNNFAELLPNGQTPPANSGAPGDATLPVVTPVPSIGIDLGYNGVTLNGSKAHGPSSPNLYQNFPVITSVITQGNTTTLQATLNGALGGETVDFYTSPNADPTGYGQGQLYLGSATVEANGTCTLLLTNVPAGQNFFTATATDAGNTSEFSAAVPSFTVYPATATQTATTLASSLNPSTYGDNVTFTATVTSTSGVPSGTVQFEVDSVVVDTETLDGTGNASFNISTLAAGSHNVIAVYNGGGAFDASPSIQLTQVVDKATSSVTVTGASFTYDGTTHTGGSAVVSGAGVIDANAAVFSYSGDQVNAGSYTVTATYAGDANHTGSVGNAPVTITPATATVTVTGFSGVYDAAPHGVVSSSATGVGGSLAGLSVDPTTYTDVPGGLVHWSFSNSNYLPQSGDAPVTITPATATVTVNDYSGTYDAGSHTANVTITGVGGVVLASNSVSRTDAGSDSVSASISDTNYQPTGGTATISIAKATANVTVNGYTGVYDAAAHGATGSAPGVGSVVLSGLDLGSTFTNTPGGTAHWTFTGGTNYTDQSGDVAITISKATANVTVNGYTGVYDAAAHGATGSATGVGSVVLSGLDLGSTFTNTPGGTAHWTFTGGTNYTDQSG
ncbi:MAG: beta strand repeat-containing protein, partial [Tepidisphaerales bacterium]